LDKYKNKKCTPKSVLRWEFASVYIKIHNINIHKLHADVVSIKQLWGGPTIEGRQTYRTIRPFSQLLKLNRVK